jgi:hypothetical protein
MATMDGVVRPPSGFVMTFASPPSITATQELVVPRSIPITFDMFFASLNLYQQKLTLVYFFASWPV